MRPLLRGVLLASFLASGSIAHGDDTLLIADFPVSTQSLKWRVVNDGVMGGRSQGGFRLAEGFLVFQGTTNTDGGGFSSIRSDIARFELGDYDGIRLRVRGDVRTYTFRVTTRDTRQGRSRPSYWAEFGTQGQGWEVVDVPFSLFRPRWRGRRLEGPELDPGAIDSLGLMIYDGGDGPFRIDVDWIRAYRAPGPFSMATFRWQKRPFLLFAENDQDARLRQQLSAVEASRDGFDERDMVLIVVLENGPARAGDRALTVDDAERLRTSYGIERGGFAFRLVGKDGGLKRQGREVIPLDTIYAQIDSMPMRQEEMRRQ
jgi:hypothetical protein